jgi:hypothetical protein
VIRFSLPWRSDHPVRRTAALGLVLLGTAGLALPRHTWAWRVGEPLVLLTALYLAVPFGSWSWRRRGVVRGVLSIGGAAVCLATLVALSFWDPTAVPLWPMFAFLALDFGLDVLGPEPLWVRALKLGLFGLLCALVLHMLHVFP